MVTLPDVLAMKAFAGDEPLAGAAFAISLSTSKDPLSLVPVGPSDERGEYVIVKDELIRLYRNAASLGLMDYGELLDEIRVWVLNRADIERARTSYETWKDAGVYPDGYASWLDERHAVLEPVSGAELRVVVEVEGGTSRVVPSLRHA